MQHFLIQMVQRALDVRKLISRDAITFMVQKILYGEVWFFRFDNLGVKSHHVDNAPLKNGTSELVFTDLNPTIPRLLR